MFMLRPMIVRPSAMLRAKKDDFVAPSEAPGEGKRRPPSWDEGDEPKKKVNLIEKFINKVFNIKPRSRPRE